MTPLEGANKEVLLDCPAPSGPKSWGHRFPGFALLHPGLLKFVPFGDAGVWKFPEPCIRLQGRLSRIDVQTLMVLKKC